MAIPLLGRVLGAIGGATRGARGAVRRVATPAMRTPGGRAVGQIVAPDGTRTVVRNLDVATPGVTIRGAMRGADGNIRRGLGSAVSQAPQAPLQRRAALAVSGAGHRVMSNPIAANVLPYAGAVAADNVVFGMLYGGGMAPPEETPMDYGMAPGMGGGGMPGMGQLDPASFVVPGAELPDSASVERELERQQRQQYYSALYANALGQAEQNRGYIEQLQGQYGPQVQELRQYQSTALGGGEYQ